MSPTDNSSGGRISRRLSPAGAACGEADRSRAARSSPQPRPRCDAARMRAVAFRACADGGRCHPPQAAPGLPGTLTSRSRPRRSVTRERRPAPGPGAVSCSTGARGKPRRRIRGSRLTVHEHDEALCGQEKRVVGPRDPRLAPIRPPHVRSLPTVPGAPWGARWWNTRCATLWNTMAAQTGTGARLGGGAVWLCDR